MVAKTLDFGADPGIAGRTVQIGSRAAVVGGVAHFYAGVLEAAGQGGWLAAGRR